MTSSTERKRSTTDTRPEKSRPWLRAGTQTKNPFFVSSRLAKSLRFSTFTFLTPQKSCADDSGPSRAFFAHFRARGRALSRAFARLRALRTLRALRVLRALRAPCFARFFARPVLDCDCWKKTAITGRAHLCSRVSLLTYLGGEGAEQL